jgi:tetratricopeptide (TPR) repeat protein
MKYLIAYILLFIVFDDINEIATINRVKDEAARAYNDGNYQEAIKSYSFLYDSLGENNDKILLNLSNAYFNAQDTSNAQFHYTKLTESGDKDIKSIAHQQLGIIANNKGKYDVALDEFKNSLRADPKNNEGTTTKSTKPATGRRAGTTATGTAGI